MNNSTRVAIVTGSSGMRGTGRAIALWLAREGYRLVLVDIKRSVDQQPPDEIQAEWKGIVSVAAEIVAQGGEALPVYCDIRSSVEVDAMVSKTLEKFGRIDLLVNNARAILGRAVDVIDMDERDWELTMDVNAKGTFLCSRSVGRYFVDAGVKGKIVNISSTAGKQGSRGRGGAAYCASKFAINGLTQCLALELASYGITVNAVCPGLIDSGRFSLEDKLGAAAAGVSIEEYARRRLAKLSSQIPTGKPLQPNDVAAMVAFLASPMADQITGQAINVNGGVLMH